LVCLKRARAEEASRRCRRRLMWAHRRSDWRSRNADSPQAKPAQPGPGGRFGRLSGFSTMVRCSNSCLGARNPVLRGSAGPWGPSRRPTGRQESRFRTIARRRCPLVAASCKEHCGVDAKRNHIQGICGGHQASCSLDFITPKSFSKYQQERVAWMINSTAQCAERFAKDTIDQVY
jgi:hypothetical protein